MVSTRQMAVTTAPTTASECSLVPHQQLGSGVGSSVQQQVFLLDMPVEILDKIFSYAGYKKVGQIRQVSRQMNQVCSLVLNSTFQKLQNQMLNRFQNVKAKMPRRESARRNHPLACECDIIETCHMRLSLLQMTFGKHIERKHCCFFPGGILDEVYNVLNYIRVTPTLARPYKVTDELFDLSTMAMEYFKEHIEPNLPEIVYFSKDFIEFTSNSKQNYLETSSSSSRDNTYSSAQPSPPHMVLRKGIRKIKQGMKKYNNQLSVLRNELRTCKKKATEQSKQIAEQQKLLAEQQKQTMDYASRLDENDKKNEEISRKFSTMLQELNKCKTELQYWRSKSPATPSVCGSCGEVVAISIDELPAFVNVATISEQLVQNNDHQLLDYQQMANSPPPPPPQLKRKASEEAAGEEQDVVMGLLESTTNTTQQQQDLSSARVSASSSSSSSSEGGAPPQTKKIRRAQKTSSAQNGGAQNGQKSKAATSN